LELVNLKEAKKEFENALILKPEHKETKIKLEKILKLTSN